MEEEQVIQDDNQEQLPADASDDDLTLEELEKVNDDDFEKYHTSEMSAKEIRDKYNLKREDTVSEKQDDDDDEQSQKEDDDNNDEEEASKQDYEAIWKEISSPFKANGKMYQPQSAKDVISLMQKGVNYTQKMQQIAPFRKVAETLKNNNIDENTLNFLIDLKNGNKNAIASLLKKNNYDSMSYDSEDADKYVPNNNMASDQSVSVSEIMEDIDANKEKISDIVFNKWDKQSQKIFADNPQLLRLLNEEIELGRFDTIQNQVEQYKMFGRNGNLPDIQLYSNLAAAYEQAEKEYSQEQTQNVMHQQERKASKKAAAPSGRTTNTGKGKSFTPQDILSMPEEEFMKLDLDKMLAR